MALLLICERNTTLCDWLKSPHKPELPEVGVRSATRAGMSVGGVGGGGLAVQQPPLPTDFIIPTPVRG